MCTVHHSARQGPSMRQRDEGGVFGNEGANHRIFGSDTLARGLCLMSLGRVCNKPFGQTGPGVPGQDSDPTPREGGALRRPPRSSKSWTHGPMESLLRRMPLTGTEPMGPRSANSPRQTEAPTPPAASPTTRPHASHHHGTPGNVFGPTSN